MADSSQGISLFVPSARAELQSSSLEDGKISDQPNVDADKVPDDFRPPKKTSEPSAGSSWAALGVVLLILLLILGSFYILNHRNNNLTKRLNALQSSLNTEASSTDQIQLQLTSLASQVVQLEGKVGGQGLQGATGSVGAAGAAGAGIAGATGAAGTTGTAGPTGPQGPIGPSGASGCIGGSCVSLQASSPGTQETGSINVSGTVIAGSLQGSGSGITTLNGSNISSGSVADARLSSNVTLQGNTFNGNSQLVQLDGSGNLPILNGSALTSLNGTNITSGTVADARLSANVALLNGSQTFTGNPLFKNTADSAAAFEIQNAAGKTVLTADTSSGQVLLGNSGASGVTGKLVFKFSGQTGSITLAPANPSSSTFSLNLPAENGTLCSTGSICTGYAPATGGSGYVQLQGSTPGSAQTGNFNVTGTGIASILQAATIDTASAVALGVGTTNATVINLNQNTAVANDKTLTANGLVVLQPATSLTAGQNALAQTFTNAAASGTVTGYLQTVTVSPSGASTTRGIDVEVTDSGAQANTTQGIRVSLPSTNSNANQTGVSVAVGRGIGVGATASNAGSSQTCADASGSLAIGVCGNMALANVATNTTAGVYGGFAGSTNTNAMASAGGSGVFGVASAAGTAANFYVGTKGRSNQTNNAAYTSVGVYGDAKGGTGASVYGGYFTLQSASTATLGAALYASNSTVATNILQLQDNATSVVTVADGGATTFENQTDSTTAFQIQNHLGSSIFTADTTNARIDIGTNGTATGQLYVSGSIPSAAASSVSTGASSQPIGLLVAGKYAYVTNFNGNTFNIYDVGVPTATPTQVSSTSTGASTGPRNVYVQGRYAYVVLAGTSGDKLLIYDIGKPATPALLSTTSTGTGSSPVAVYVQGRYAYIADNGSSTFMIYDVFNPTAPALVSAVTNSAVMNGPGSIFVQGKYAYIVSITSGGLVAFDVSNPASPVTGTAYITGISQPRAVYVQGKYAYIANSGGDNLVTLNVADPLNPAAGGSISTGASTGPYSVSVQGRYAYVTLKTSALLQTIDITNPASPALVGAGVATGSNPWWVQVQGRYAYVINNGASTMQLFDVGGEYAQQLEAGGIEAGTLQVNSDANVNGDASIQGGLNVGATIQAGGNLGVGGGATVQGGVVLAGGSNSLATPAAPTVTPQGVTGSTNYSYTITAVNAYGGETVASAAGSTATGNATLTSSNFNRVTWGAVSGASGYKIYRTVAGGTSPTTTGLVGIASGTTFDDKALLANGSAPTTDTSGQLTVQGSALFKNSSNSTTAFQIQNATGTTIFTADTTNAKIIITTLQVSGHIISAGTTPGIAAGAAAGSGPTVSVVGNDIAGTVTVTTGGSGATTGILATITFVNAYGAAPIVVLTPSSGTGTTLQYYAGSGTTTFTVNTNNAAANGTTYTYYYHILQ